MIRLVAASLIALALALAGCGSTAEPAPTEGAGQAYAPYVLSIWVDTVDGRRIPCVWAAKSEKGGLSCDWSSK